MRDSSEWEGEGGWAAPANLLQQSAEPVGSWAQRVTQYSDLYRGGGSAVPVDAATLQAPHSGG